MPKPPKVYRKLPGRGATFTHYTRLYFGPDHLLQVASTGFTETYKRFYFGDIQALTIRKTQAGRITNSVLGGVIAIFALPALFTPEIGTIILMSFAAVFALLLGANVAMGPTCVSHLQTAVQNEKVPSLSRLRRARRVLQILKPRIAAVQGEVTGEEIRARLAGQFAPAPAAVEAGLPPVIPAGA